MAASAAARLLCVFSTLTAAVEYVRWNTGKNGVPVHDGSVTIKGGAGVANSNIVTPRGVPTMITADQRRIIESNAVYQLHKKGGFVTIEEVDRPPSETDVENAAANMEGRDGSAPLVPQDFTANGQKAPTVGDGGEAS